jgi:uncharacterized protein YhaN
MQPNIETNKPARMKLSAAILLGCLSLSIVFFLIGPQKIVLFVGSFSQSDRETQQEAQQKIERYRLQAKQNEAKAEEERIQAEAQLRLQMDQKQRQQEELLAKINNRDAETQDKQLKWTRFFRESSTCVKPQTWEKQVACADERMKAEQRFEELYREGKL